MSMHNIFQLGFISWRTQIVVDGILRFAVSTAGKRGSSWTLPVYIIETSGHHKRGHRQEHIQQSRHGRGFDAGEDIIFYYLDYGLLITFARGNILCHSALAIYISSYHTTSQQLVGLLRDESIQQVWIRDTYDSNLPYIINLSRLTKQIIIINCHLMPPSHPNRHDLT